MVRVSKSPEERKAEIVATARRLFSERGVDETSVSDIVKTMDVAQGTFYYYFPSKEDVVNAAVAEIADEICEEVFAVSRNPRLGVLAKFNRLTDLLVGGKSSEGSLMEHFHRPEHHEVHDQLVAELIRRLEPVVSEMLEQGVTEGVFKTDYPEEDARFVLYVTLAFEDETAQGTPSKRRRKALLDFVMKGLGAPAKRG